MPIRVISMYLYEITFTEPEARLKMYYVCNYIVLSHLGYLLSVRSKQSVYLLHTFFSEGSGSRLSLYYPIVGRIETHDEARALWRTFVNHLCDPRTRQ